MPDQNDIRKLTEAIENLRITLSGGVVRTTPTYKDPFPSPFQGRETEYLGPMEYGRYKNYYSRDNTILIAGPTNPQSPDSNIYNREFVWNELHRYANVQVVNRGADNLFVICSHSGNTFTSSETVLPPGATKYYYNVWGFLLRSPTVGLPYTITEYPMELWCCPTEAGTQDVDVIDRCARLLGQLCVGGAAIDPRDVSDRCARLLGQLCVGGVAIDPRDRNWTLDFATDQVDVTGSTVTVNPLTQFTPISKGTIHNTALPLATVSFFVADISPTNTPSGIRITAAISIPGVLSAKIINGGNTQITSLNNGVALVGGALNVFEFMVHSGDTVNFSYSVTGGTIQVVRVEEIDAAVI